MRPCFGLVSLLVLAAQAADEYQYDTNAVKASEKKGGQRLVGASAGESKKIPFVVGWNGMPGGPTPQTSCTGSLIAPTWMVSAAHCTEYIAHENRDALNEECVAKTARGEEFKSERGATLKCRWLKDKHLEIAPSSPKGLIWVGVNDVSKPEEVAAGFSTTIAKIIRHAQSYKGGGSYGRYGGYDITLVNFDQPVPATYKPACLPTLSFDDLRPSSLAGYGKYFRDNGDTCMTDQYGKYKYHYCKDSGSGADVCKSTPPEQNPLCQKFLKEVYKPAMEEFEDFVIVTKDKPVMCFHPTDPNPSSKGWCETKDDFYGFEVKELPEGPQNWGYCSKDCYLNSEEKGSGVLRAVEKVDVLPEEICKRFLQAAMPEGAKVQPQVICVGQLRPYKTDVWQFDGTSFTKASPDVAKSMQHPLDRTGLGEKIDKYVASAGTCNGDSGGPIYIQEGPNKFVVTGAVSGGRGLMGKCGGVNNPTHYVRLKMLAPWIVKMLGEDSRKICWHEKFQKGLDMKLAGKVPKQNDAQKAGKQVAQTA